MKFAKIKRHPYGRLSFLDMFIDENKIAVDNESKIDYNIGVEIVKRSL